MSKGLECLKKIKKEYDAYYYLQTHHEEFEYLSKLLEDDEYAQTILKVLIRNYSCECYNPGIGPYDEKNANNPFYLLEQKIKEKEKQNGTC